MDKVQGKELATVSYTASSKPYSICLLKIFHWVKHNSALWSTSLGMKTFSIQLWRRLNKPLSCGQCSWHFCANVADTSPDTHNCVRRTLAVFSRVCPRCGSVSRLSQDGVLKSPQCELFLLHKHTMFPHNQRISLLTQQCCRAEVTDYENVLLSYYNINNQLDATITIY